jgi:hypothetical protein
MGGFFQIWAAEMAVTWSWILVTAADGHRRGVGFGTIPLAWGGRWAKLRIERLIMATLTIELSDDLRSKAQARASKAGYASLADYLSFLVRADLESSREDAALPKRVSVGIRDELEKQLAEGLESPAREVTPAAWEAEQVNRLTARHAASKAG